MFCQNSLTFVLLIPAVCSLGVLIYFFVSIGRAFKKFNSLDSTVQRKLLFLEYYMAVVRNLSKEELIKLGTLPDEEIKQFNIIHGYDERIQTIRDKINSPAFPVLGKGLSITLH
jgi:hypothetical protein